jgi:hypothetical protein
MKSHHWPKFLVLISLFIASLNADAYRGFDRETADEKRVALVIGNSNYRQHYLPNPRNGTTPTKIWLYRHPQTRPQSAAIQKRCPGF